MTRVRVKRLAIGSGANRTALYDENTCQPMYAVQTGPKSFEVTLTDGNYDYTGDPLEAGEFELDTEYGSYRGFAEKQMPGLGRPEKIELTLLAE